MPVCGCCGAGLIYAFQSRYLVFSKRDEGEIFTVLVEAKENKQEDDTCLAGRKAGKIRLAMPGLSRVQKT